MAKFFLNGKWKKRTVTALTLALSLSLSAGILTACGSKPSDNNDDEDDDTPAALEADTQTLKNGNFEFYSEMNTELADKRALIYSPTSWSFTSGSPSSDTASGIVNAKEWDHLTKSTQSLILKDGEGKVLHYDDGKGASLSQIMDNAVNNWDKASAYDRLEFLKEYSTELKHADLDKTYTEFFDDYKYSIDFEDVENLRADLGDNLKLHYTEEKDTNGSNVLMIHNQRRSDGVTGTAQSYTSSTTITLAAGTSAKLSVWVKTAELYHYYYDSDDKGTPVTKNAGAYIGVTHTVGGTTLDQMQIKNINTSTVDGLEDTNGWQQYSIYIRANTYATSTFKIVLGLGMGDSANRYEQVTGYALFDDLTCEIVKSEEYPTDVENECGIDSLKEKKIFNMTTKPATEFALDLQAEFKELALTDVEPTTTKEYSGTKEYDSADIVPDERYSDSNKDGNIVGLTTLDELKTISDNGYLAPILENDFKNFPFENKNLVMLLSTNGAAYTATVEHDAFTVGSKSRILVSFFVKTSEIRSGKTGASAILVDKNAGTETAISAFDSTTVSTVDIKDTNGNVTVKDIYDGWVQCFFFVENTTDDPLSFNLKLTYGPTAVQSSTKSSYCDGYAAFANFQTQELSKTQYGYATSGTYAKTVSLTGKTTVASPFADNSITTPFENGGFGTPVNFYGVQSGSINLVSGGHKNPTKDTLVKDGLYTGLLNYESEADYATSDWAGELGMNADAQNWWKTYFGDNAISGMVASQPLVIMNAGSNTLPAYGYLASKKTVAASTYEKISVRVKLSAGATASVYLIDTSENQTKNQLMPVMPKITYWYDDEGNICAGDPSEKETKVAYYLNEDNGLYTSANKNDKNYYANLNNYDKDEDGNLVTTDGTIAFYAKDGKFYAYREGKTADKYVYKQEVQNLPTEGDIVRYLAPESMASYGSCIQVDGSKVGTDKWVTVSFYVHTGSEAKSYRLEVWAGARDCVTATDEEGNVSYVSGTGIPAGEYVFFDAYSDATTSDYDKLLAEYVDAKKAELNEGVAATDKNFLAPDDKFYKDGDKSYGDYFIYYTFTFYDSPDWMRYDVSTDDLDKNGDPLGNPYGSYKQSTYSEKLVWFAYDGSASSSPVYAQFLDYSASNVDVQKDDLGKKDEGKDNTDSTGGSNTNIWLVLSSVLLAAVIVFALGAIVVRKVLKNRRRNAPAKAPKQKKEKAPKLKVVKSVDEPKDETPEDENNPYNE